MKSYIGVFLGICMMALIAAKPWHKINRAVGVVTAADSVASDSATAAQTNSDSLFLEQVAVVLPKQATDSLANVVARQTKQKEYLIEQEAMQDEENEKINQRLQAKRKKANKMQQEIASLDQIEGMLARQRQRQHEPAEADKPPK